MKEQISRTESNLTLLREFNDAVFVDNDFDRLGEFVAPEFVQVESGEVTVEGVDGLAAYFEDVVETYEDTEMDVIDAVADDDTVMYNFRMHGTLARDLRVDGERIDSAGTDLAWDGFAALSIEDEQITGVRLLTDEAAIYRQLGVLPEIGA